MAFRADILIGAKAADELQLQLNTRDRVESSHANVDVFGSIAFRKAALLFRKLEGILGAYIPAKTPGILITTQRPLPIQRFTAAHELGHCFMNHKPSFDGEEILDFTANAESMEAQANGFAAEFLMPKWLLKFHARRQGWDRQGMLNPGLVYQLSLRLGTSYLATCLSLKNHGILNPVKADKLLNIEPKAIKRSILPDHVPVNWHFDVWVLTDKDRGAVLQGQPEDLFLLRLGEIPGAGYLWNIEDLEGQGFKILKDVQIENEEEVGSPMVREVTASAESSLTGKMAMGLGRPWQKNEQPAERFQLDYDLRGKESGISRAERTQLRVAA